MLRCNHDSHTRSHHKGFSGNWKLASGNALCNNPCSGAPLPPPLQKKYCRICRHRRRFFHRRQCYPFKDAHRTACISFLLTGIWKLVTSPMNPFPTPLAFSVFLGELGDLYYPSAYFSVSSVSLWFNVFAFVLHSPRLAPLFPPDTTLRQPSPSQPLHTAPPRASRPPVVSLQRQFVTNFTCYAHQISALRLISASSASQRFNFPAPFPAAPSPSATRCPASGTRLYPGYAL